MNLGINKFVDNCDDRGCKFWEYKSPECHMCRECYDGYLAEGIGHLHSYNGKNDLEYELLGDYNGGY